MRAAARAGIVLLGLGSAVPGIALGATPVAGNIVLRREGGPHPDVLSFVSRDPSFALEDPGSPDAPELVGIRLDVVSVEQGSQIVTAPAGDGWRRSRAGRWVRYKSRVVRVRVRDGYLQVKTEPQGISLKHRQGAVGVLVTMGAETMCVWFDGEAIRDDRPGLFVGKRTTPGPDCGPLPSMTTTSLPAGSTTTSVPGSSTTSTTLQPGACGAESTFQIIQERLFDARGCTTSTCHGAFNTSGLDLRPGSSHVSLVDVPATNATAAAAGKQRIVPGGGYQLVLTGPTLQPGQEQEG